jgi:hypothetical protein
MFIKGEAHGFGVRITHLDPHLLSHRSAKSLNSVVFSVTSSQPAAD